MRASTLLTVALVAYQTHGALAVKYVWAHFMVSNTKGYTQAHWEYEMQRAKDNGIDGFALNFAYNETETTPYLYNAFNAANAIGVKLFFSLDYGPKPQWPQKEASAIINLWKNNNAYFKYNGKPLVSTFEGPDKADDWKLIKPETGCFFMPSFSSLGAKKAVATGVVDGLFSWGAWGDGPLDMLTEVDESYREFLGGKPFMMPVSPWFFTNMPGFRKNWLWRGDDMWYDRWIQVLSLQPEMVQIISWNDYGESHYIGPAPRLSSGYEAFSRGKAPFNYATLTHDGWRVTTRYWAGLYKNGVGTVTKEAVVAWYRQTEAGKCDSGGTTGNTASQLQTTYPPGQLSQDKIFFDAVLGSSATVSVSIGGATVSATWENIPDGGVGVYHGSVSFTGYSGQVVVTVYRGGSAVVQAVGPSILASCPNAVMNWNAVVAFKEGSTISTKTTSPNMLKYCTSGRGRGLLGAVCQTACKYSYCPSVCTCTSLGSTTLTWPKGPTPPVVGCPKNGLDVRFMGLCNMTAGIGQAPIDACQLKPYGSTCAVVPVADPPIPVCKAGTSDGIYKDLCAFSCYYNFCPGDVCMCTEAGLGGNTAPSKNALLGAGTVGLDNNDFGLCEWACSRNFCPFTACKRVITGVDIGAPGGGNTPGSVDRNIKWSRSIKIIVDGDPDNTEVLEGSGDALFLVSTIRTSIFHGPSGGREALQDAYEYYALNAGERMDCDTLTSTRTPDQRVGLEIKRDTLWNTNNQIGSDETPARRPPYNSADAYDVFGHSCFFVADDSVDWGNAAAGSRIGYLRCDGTRDQIPCIKPIQLADDAGGTCKLVGYRPLSICYLPNKLLSGRSDDSLTTLPALRRDEIQLDLFYYGLRDPDYYQPNRQLFYTRRRDRDLEGLSWRATVIAAIRGWQTIWEGWNTFPVDGPASIYYDWYNVESPNGWLRAIRRGNAPYQPHDDQDEYFRGMSRTFANQARGEVFVMTEDPTNVLMEGIWGEEEWDSIRRPGTPVTKVIAIDMDGLNWHVIFDPNDPTITPQNPRAIETPPMPSPFGNLKRGMPIIIGTFGLNKRELLVVGGTLVDLGGTTRTTKDTYGDLCLNVNVFSDYECPTFDLMFDPRQYERRANTYDDFFG